ncbi:MAG: ATP-dependent sacrificial sulfur transferase LarE [Sporomusaceae bacterium]|nr:ATP-dependent sacrificial sulfur transferase LarE [Sporomusaceae bacterium]
MDNLEEKVQKLQTVLRSYDKAVIAFSGGVDSTFLAAAAKSVMTDLLLVTARSESLTQKEQEDCRAIAATLEVPQLFLEAGEFDDPDFVNNTAERCYFCKKNRFSALATWAKERGYAYILDGTNVDDQGDYRPGLKALAEIPMVKSPLLEAGFHKTEIRQLSKAWRLPTWNKPSAACLVSRLIYGLPITRQRLKQVEEAEILLASVVKGQFRVRHHGNLARIEVEPDQIAAIMVGEEREKLVSAFKAIGFTYVTIDLGGYRTGSMNEMLELKDHVE